MKRINVDKVVINIGVGKSGEPIEKAKKAFLELTGQQPAVRGAKKLSGTLESTRVSPLAR